MARKCIVTRLDYKDYAKVLSIAKERSTSASGVIRWCVEQMLKDKKTCKK